MKKFLVEYINLIGKTVLGLVFGLSFFLLFLNFYHYKEIRTVYTPSQENGTDYEKLLRQVDVIKQNAAAYSQNTYQGNEDVFDMLGMQSKLNACAQAYENETLKNLLSKESYVAEDVYELVNYYQNSILNDCIVLQFYSFGDSTSTTYKSERLRSISPFLKVEMDNLLNSSTGYVKNNLKNNDIYYFSNEDSKNTVFELTKDSYQEMMGQYKSTLNFLETFSNWYKNVAQGG